MKKVYRDKITHLGETDKFENIFQFDIFENPKKSDFIKIVYIKDELLKKKNTSILEKLEKHPAMWSEVYSPKDEMEIFEKFFHEAIENNQKTHIVWLSLDAEVKILEQYYQQLWFFSQEINCFDVDYRQVLVSGSVYIENLMYRWSDYKREREKIFFCPPIREAWQVKAVFSGINRGSVAGIFIEKFSSDVEQFLQKIFTEEQIPTILLAKVLKYNFEGMWMRWIEKQLEVNF